MLITATNDKKTTSARLFFYNTGYMYSKNYHSNDLTKLSVWKNAMNNKMLNHKTALTYFLQSIEPNLQILWRLAIWLTFYIFKTNIKVLHVCINYDTDRKLLSVCKSTPSLDQTVCGIGSPYTLHESRNSRPVTTVSWYLWSDVTFISATVSTHAEIIVTEYN